LYFSIIFNVSSTYILQILTYILFVHTYAVYLLAAFNLITGKPVFTLSGCFLLGKTSSWCNVKSISRSWRL